MLQVIFYGTIDVDPGPYETQWDSFGTNDIFFTKLTPNGDLLWANRLINDGAANVSDLVVDSFGSCYAIGYFKNIIKFNNWVSNDSLVSDGLWDTFIVKIDANGNLNRLNKIGNIAHDLGTAIAVDSSGSVYLSGSFAYNIDVDPGGGTNVLSTNGVSDIYLLKWNQCYIDPSVEISSYGLTSNAIGASYQWIDCNNGNAPIAGETSQTLSLNSNGSYAVVISNGTCSDTSACIDVDALSAQDVTLENRIVVYPNPANQIITIKGYENLENCSIVNIVGEQVLLVHSEITDVSFLSPGIYYLSGQFNKNRVYVKFMVE